MPRVGVVRLDPEVRAAVADGRAVVALESSVLAQGLPAPANAEAAQAMLRAVRDTGAVPAITGVVDGVVAAGLSSVELARFLERRGVVKVSTRDLPTAMARRLDGATTVAAALRIAHLAGIRVFATGGIGGVHRTTSAARATYDESADLIELSRTPLVVVCAGAKAILDLPGTMERLETFGVSVVGYRTSELPGFVTAQTGIGLETRVENAAEAAAIYLAQRRLELPAALLLVQSPPAGSALPADLVRTAVDEAVSRASREGVGGAALTPWLLRAIGDATGGKSLGANLALLEANARLAAEVARELEAKVEVRTKGTTARVARRGSRAEGRR
jgi:pseudouridine-5'-phosphate glycosidase